MSEAHPRQAVVLGLFITVGLAILVAMLLTIGNLRGGFGRSIHVGAEFSDVGGLTTGDSVWYAGVPVGQVDRVRLGGPSRVAVELAIDAAVSEHIPADVVATIGADGLIGNQIVILSEGSAASGPLEPGATLATGTSVTPEQLMASFQEIAADAKVLTSQLAESNVVEDIEKTSSQLATFTTQLNRNETLDTLEGAVADAAELVEGLQQSAADARTPLGVVLQDRSAGGDLEDTLENLNQSSVLLSENLEAMQHNFLLRGFFKRKERREREEAELDTFMSAVERAAR